jgi:sugar phosphate isomerase/epimerase
VINRRQHIKKIFAAPFALSTLARLQAQAANFPIGVQLFTLRNDLEKELPAVLKQVSGAGYKYIEFYVPFYFTWTLDRAQEVRMQMEDADLRCTSTHNTMDAFTEQGIGKAIELNQTLGARTVISARRPMVSNLDGWKQVADVLNKGNEKLRAAGLRAAYHNTAVEWKSMEGQTPMDVLMANTDPTFGHQLDVGTCVAAGADPVTWIKAHPGRIRSLHLKDWSPAKEYGVLFGQGKVPWREVFTAAEDKGGAEFYVIEQETSVEPPLDAVRQDLERYRALRREMAQ